MLFFVPGPDRSREANHRSKPPIIAHRQFCFVALAIKVQPRPDGAIEAWKLQTTNPIHRRRCCLGCLNCKAAALWNPVGPCGTFLWKPGGTLVKPSWNLTSGPPRTTPEPIWAETPKLSAVGGKEKKNTRHHSITGLRASEGQDHGDSPAALNAWQVAQLRIAWRWTWPSICSGSSLDTLASCEPCTYEGDKMQLKGVQEPALQISQPQAPISSHSSACFKHLFQDHSSHSSHCTELAPSSVGAVLGRCLVVSDLGSQQTALHINSLSLHVVPAGHFP